MRSLDSMTISPGQGKRPLLSSKVLIFTFWKFAYATIPILIGTDETCQRVLYCASICTALTFGTAASVDASEESTACTLNARSGDEDLFWLNARAPFKALLATLIAVRPSTPIAIPSTTSSVRKRRRVTSAIDLRVSAPPGNGNLITAPPLIPGA